MSSESEDDCYGNVAQRLQMMKNQFQFLDSSQDTPKITDKSNNITENSADVTCVELKDDSDCAEISLDTIIAQNSKKKAVRRSKRNADISVDNCIKTPGRKRTRNSLKANNSVVTVDLDVTTEKSSDTEVASDTAELVENTTFNTTSRNRTRGKRRGRPRGGANNTINRSNLNTNNNVSTVSPNHGENAASVSTARTNEVRSSPTLRPRSHGRRGRRPNQARRTSDNLLNQFLSAMFGAPQTYNDLITYSVGNTDEYTDESYNQPLFKSNSNQSKKDEVVVVETDRVDDLNESLDGNEELSVKVYWQNRECVKFTIRRFQKLQTIFDFFANREKVDRDRLFFTYNDKILKKDDTPDSITYNEVKFIDGGIINQRLNIVQEQGQEKVQNGIKLKFQCQNVKKPFEVYIKPEEKLAVAMMQCAEHLEKPLDKLKFLFDGDLITGKNTPNELELEGGECIDVKIIS